MRAVLIGLAVAAMTVGLTIFGFVNKTLGVILLFGGAALWIIAQRETMAVIERVIAGRTWRQTFDERESRKTLVRDQFFHLSPAEQEAVRHVKRNGHILPGQVAAYLAEQGFADAGGVIDSISRGVSGKVRVEKLSPPRSRTPWGSRARLSSSLRTHNKTCEKYLRRAPLPRAHPPRPSSYSRSLYCDTDSLAIVASKKGGTLRIPGAHGKRILTWDEVDRIAAKFRALNPYDPGEVPGLLNLTDDNYVCTCSHELKTEHDDTGACGIVEQRFRAVVLPPS